MDGHDHIYERFTPMKSGATPADQPVADATYGIQQFTVGMGGEAHHNLSTTLGTSLVRNNTDFGIFKLTLHATTYDWVFLPIAGSTFTDSGTGTVHDAPVAPTHTVSGTLTPGVAGAVVWAYKASDGSYVSGVVTGAGGTYSLALAPDSYKLWITGAPGYPDQAYGPDGTFANATVVDLTTADQPGTDITLAAPATHTVSGTLTPGVAGAVVWAYKASDGSYVSGVVTGAGGTYSLALAPDSYKLWITGAPGYPDQAYGPDGTFANATVVDLTTADQPGTDITLAAPATHTVSGTLTPGVAGAVVWAYKASDGSYVSGVVTGAGGTYSLALAPDSYKLWITGAPGYPDQAYGPDGTFANATVVDLTTADQPGTDITLAAPATHTVSGTLTPGVAGAVVWAYKASDGSYVSGVVTGAGGTYSLALAPDSYKLWITGAPGYPDQAYGPDGTFANATVVDLTTADQPGTDITLAASLRVAEAHGRRTTSQGMARHSSRYRS